MIIDQLTPTVSDNLADEVPVEQGTATFKTTWQKILNLFKGNITASDISSTDGDVQSDISDLQSDKQDTLVSGVNIKTVGGNSLLGSGDIQAGGALYFTGVPCSAMTGNFVNYNSSKITANHVVAECVFANPSAITTDVTWTTASGSVKLNGTCSTATTANLVLIKKDN